MSKHISEILPALTTGSQQEQRSLSVFLEKTSQLTERESKVILLKYKSPQLGSFSDDELFRSGMALLLKIHVITGWVIPKDELLNILVDQFCKNIAEKFSTLNADEIEFAFRNSGTTVEDYGKQMNLNLVDKVLWPYVQERFAISETERKLKETPPEQKIFSEEELLNSSREMAEMQYQRHLRREELINSQISKEILLKDNLLKEDETVVDFFLRMALRGYRHIYQKSDNHV